MSRTLSISYLWSKSFLLSRMMLWALLWVNGLGTIYGFQWYSAQIVFTLQQKAIWLVWFVPDSPTASLFFTVAIAFLLRDHYAFHRTGNMGSTEVCAMRGLVEAFAVITSIKYGIWAVAMIVAGAVQGDTLNWQHGMLIVSHLGMAIEALIFVRFFTFRTLHIGIAALWTLSNDMIDYRFGVFPGLPKQLHDFLPMIKKVTIGLSIFSILCAYVSLKIRNKSND